MLQQIAIDEITRVINLATALDRMLSFEPTSRILSSDAMIASTTLAR
ncbi:hypothetical protein [Bradyrhizobium australafricanum]|nr:hypothetical protein [Bradyrhizobium australafricanum]MCA6103964.1 hypothetical protein [Bradyrhizobium australafricanum]